MVRMEAEARRSRERVEHEKQREDRLRETEVKTMKKSLKRSNKKAKKKMAIKLDKLAKMNTPEDALDAKKDDQEDVAGGDGQKNDAPKAMLGRFAAKKS